METPQLIEVNSEPIKISVVDDELVLPYLSEEAKIIYNNKISTICYEYEKILANKTIKNAYVLNIFQY